MQPFTNWIYLRLLLSCVFPWFFVFVFNYHYLFTWNYSCIQFGCGWCGTLLNFSVRWISFCVSFHFPAHTVPRLGFYSRKFNHKHIHFYLVCQPYTSSQSVSQSVKSFVFIRCCCRCGRGRGRHRRHHRRSRRRVVVVVFIVCCWSITNSLWTKFYQSYAYVENVELIFFIASSIDRSGTHTCVCVRAYVVTKSTKNVIVLKREENVPRIDLTNHNNVW